jgi:hypothetical protein
MSHDDRTLLREMRALVLVLVAGLAGCQFGPSSGSLHYEGADPMGGFSGDVSAWDCHGSFSDGYPGQVWFGGTNRGDVISLLPEPGDWAYVTKSVHVLTRGGVFEVDRSTCRAYDVRKWFDGKKHLHVVVVLDDCKTADGVRVQGSVRSDLCYVDRPR